MRTAFPLALLLFAGAPALADDSEQGRQAAQRGVAERRPGSAAVLAEVPFLGEGDAGAVFIDLSPPGSVKELRLQLDTGATQTVLTPGYARELGVRIRRDKSTPYRRKTLLGRDLQFYVDTRLSDTGGRTRMDYGLLGGNFLSHYVVEVDYPGRTVRFLDPDHFEVPKETSAAGEAVLPMRLVSNRPLVRVQVNGETVQMLLDTGGSLGLLLGGREARKAGLEGRSVAGLALHGVLGEIGVEFAEAGSVRLGPFPIEPCPVLVAPRGMYQQGTASDSVIGHDVLASYVVRLDYPRRRVWLGAAGDATPVFFGSDYTLVRRSGAVLYHGEAGVTIGMVIGGSAAERLGLRPQDVFDEVDPGDPELDVEALHAAIEGGGPLRIRRPTAGGDWQAETLGSPSPGTTPGAPVE